MGCFRSKSGAFLRLWIRAMDFFKILHNKKGPRGGKRCMNIILTVFPKSKFLVLANGSFWV